MEGEDIFNRCWKPLTHPSQTIIIHANKRVLQIQRIFRDGEAHHRSYGTDDTTDTGPSHGFSNQIIPILQGISPAVVCQALRSTCLNQIGTHPLSGGMEGLALISTLLSKVCFQGLRQRDICLRTSRHVGLSIPRIGLNRLSYQITPD